MTKIICGADVSKARLDVHVSPSGEEKRFANTAKGLAAFAAFCAARGVELVALEATGGYEQAAADAAREAGLGVVVVNPKQVRRFAEAMGAIEKTDRIDARLIARFAEVRALEPQPAPGPRQRRLKALAARLRQIAEDIAVNRRRRSSARDEETKASLSEVIALLEAQTKRILKEIASLIDHDPLLRRLDRALREIKGVAAKTVARLLADMPEIGTWSNKAVTKLAGLAPIADDSGPRRGRRRIQGGRAPVRSALYIAGGVAGRHEPDFIAVRERLIAAGKPKMVARIALARKLLVRLNAKARDARIAFQNAA